MQGQLFTSDFLFRGIKETEPWQALSDQALDAFIDRLKQLYSGLAIDTQLNEAQTEDELIAPILAELGWHECWLSQVNMSEKGREDVPDFLLFPDPAAKARAMGEKDDGRVRHGIALIEAKRWMRVLDRNDENAAANRKKRDFGAPSSQMLRYLSRADVMSDRAVKWGMLTNGGVWRLYWQDARSRAEDFFEIDVAAALEIPGAQPELDKIDARDALKLFFLLFHRAAFLLQPWDSQRRTFHAIALSEARLYEEIVSQNLGERVFKEVFPSLANALASNDLGAVKNAHGQYDRGYLDEVREATLVLLYRLLFVLYAEDRRLLPVTDSRYAPYSLSVLRDEIAHACDSGAVLSKRAANYWHKLSELFLVIAEGDDQLGMPAYNGGLFERARAPILARIRVTDAQMAPVIDALSRRVEDIFKPRINYRDLSVSHLGGIYERLLAYSLVQEDITPPLSVGGPIFGPLLARPASFARKGSGSYYTHDDLVRLILDEAVGLLTTERSFAYEQLLGKYKKKTALKPYEWDALESADTASQILELKICDPAMGSGHFLVALVDYLADRVLEAIQTVDDAVNEAPWAAHLVERGTPWTSPVVARVADIRRRIQKAAKEHGWAIDSRQLDDRHIIRRMILKKVVFGVDKNPMAVELAKVALWLHTFTVGAPLSFLDHHLKCGDSLHGEKLDTVRAGMAELGALFQDAELTRLEIAAQSLDAVAELTDTSIAEAHESKQLADAAARQVAPIHALLDFWRALRWLVPGWPTSKIGKIKDEHARIALAELFSDHHILSGVVAAGKIAGEGPEIDAANALLARAGALSKRENFFHWWTAFPTVWRGSGGKSADGFDAVIGNPPWDRIKLQQIEWFAERKPAIALQTRAADRAKLIKEEERRKTALWKEYGLAVETAEASARVIRNCDEFPMLSGGDINIYSLFVERAQALTHNSGIIGLLTPSGIAADKGASEFFRSISSTGRLGALLDFENRNNPGGSYFPDVDSRFKFSALIFGAAQRSFEVSRCAFFLHRLDELVETGRVLTLTAQDFTLVNPNTGAAPIFRNQRDADITTRIYRRHPILVNRSNGREQRAWPVKYVTVFHMTNDSHLFMTRAEMEKAGWKPAELNRLKKSQALAYPLYAGRMMNIFDHRASHVKVNESNLHNAALSTALSDAEKKDVNRFPEPQYWVSADAIPNEYRVDWALAFRDIARSTDARTMIASFVPTSACSNKLPLLMSTDTDQRKTSNFLPLLLAGLNSLAFDFVTRQKIQSTSINWFIVEQLPIISPETFEQSIGGINIADYIRTEVLALTYTAHDMAPFARDMGYLDAAGQVKPPFVWDTEDRVHRMARLDALFMHLYGLSEDDADYILSTFPIVREKDMAAHRTFRTRDLILAYMQRIAAGQLRHDDFV